MRGVLTNQNVTENKTPNLIKYAENNRKIRSGLGEEQTIIRKYTRFV